MTKMAPDAAARDAHNRKLAGNGDGVVRGEGIDFITRNVSAEEKAAVIAVLLAQQEAETNRVRRVESKNHEPWARSQRTPEGIDDFLAGA